MDKISRPLLAALSAVRVTAIYLPAYPPSRKFKTPSGKPIAFDFTWFTSIIDRSLAEVIKLPKDVRGNKIIVQMPEALFTAKVNAIAGQGDENSWENEFSYTSQGVEYGLMDPATAQKFVRDLENYRLNKIQELKIDLDIITHTLQLEYDPTGQQDVVKEKCLVYSYASDGMREQHPGFQEFPLVSSQMVYIGNSTVASGKMNPDPIDRFINTRMKKSEHPAPFFIFTKNGYVFKSMMVTCRDLVNFRGTPDLAVWAAAAGMPQAATFRSIFACLSVNDLQGVQGIYEDLGSGTGVYIQQQEGSTKPSPASKINDVDVKDDQVYVSHFDIPNVMSMGEIWRNQLEHTYPYGLFWAISDIHRRKLLQSVANSKAGKSTSDSPEAKKLGEILVDGDKKTSVLAISDGKYRALQAVAEVEAEDKAKPPKK